MNQRPQLSDDRAEASDVRRVIVVGGGLAGAKAAEELRSLGYDGDITMVGGEPHAPYERPPLSKEILLGSKTADDAAVHPTEWYAEHDIELLLGTPATGWDLAARTLTVANRALPYDRMVLATGAEPRKHTLADESGAEVLYLRAIEDALALRERLQQHVVIVGGGWIGLEVAAAARAAGGDVTIIEAAAVPLGTILGPDIARVFADLHRSHGVDLRVNTTVTAVDQKPGHARVQLSDGTHVSADLIVVGIGARPNTALAAAAGLAADNGVLVNSRLQTSDPHVYAAGDVANHDHPLLGRIRVEHWDNAIQQGRHAARSILGDTTPYTRQPYFFSDQYDMGIEYVGHIGAGYDDILVHGDLDDRVFTAWWTRDATIVAGMHAGQWDAIDQIRKLVGGPAAALER